MYPYIATLFTPSSPRLLPLARALWINVCMVLHLDLLNQIRINRILALRLHHGSQRGNGKRPTNDPTRARQQRAYSQRRCYAALDASAFTGGVNGTLPSTSTLPFASSALIFSAACPSRMSDGEDGEGIVGTARILVISRTKEVPQNAAEYLLTYCSTRSQHGHNTR